MSDRESRGDEQVARLLGSLRGDTVSSPPGLRRRVQARIHSELLRRDLLDLFTGAPARVLRQLLRRPATGSRSEDPTSGAGE
jgi:hypothetical protein